MNILTLVQTLIKLVAAVLLSVAAVLGLLPAGPADTPSITATTTSAANFPTATSSPSAQPAQATTTKLVVAVAQKPTPTPATVPTATTLSDADLNTLVRGALVNIECTTLAGGAFKPISGSGVVIDSRGIILTNAHVGQFFLLRDYLVANNVTCVIRTGSPATPRYTAELLYLPQSWIDDNAKQITAPVATGTGENDYAFLYITGTTNPSATLPSSFPALAWSTTPPVVGDRMILASYPAGLLGGDIIATSLYASSAFAKVSQLLSFTGAQTIDVFNIGGTVASQAGSSGGPVADPSGNLRGIISTANLAATTGDSALYAISLGHISRSLAAEGQGGIPVLLDGDVAAKAANFNATVAKYEAKKLEDVLNGN